MLVKIEGKKGEERIVVSSRQVAEDFGKRHDKLFAEIGRMYGDLIAGEKGIAPNGGDPFFFLHEYTHPQNHQTYKEYLMNRDGFALLVMGFTGDEALQWKIKYIAAFNEMEKELKRLYEERRQWEIERAKGILIRHILTDTIKNLVAESPHKKFMYSNYTKLIYKVLFNSTVQELREQYKVQGKETLRDSLSEEDLKDVENLERLVASLIGIGWGYEQIKTFLFENATKKLE